MKGLGIVRSVSQAVFKNYGEASRVVVFVEQRNYGNARTSLEKNKGHLDRDYTVVRTVREV